MPTLSWGMDKNELKEELEYWKSLLDDELISQKDYDLKKNELLNYKSQTSINSNTNITSEEVSGHETYFPLDMGRTLSLQNKLNNLGYEIAVDGVAGKETNQALEIWKSCNNQKNYNHKTHTKLLKSESFCPDEFKPIYELAKNPDFYELGELLGKPEFYKIRSLNKGTPYMIIGKTSDYWKIKLETEVIGIGTKTNVGFISAKYPLIKSKKNVSYTAEKQISVQNSNLVKLAILQPINKLCYNDYNNRDWLDFDNLREILIDKFNKSSDFEVVSSQLHPNESKEYWNNNDYKKWENLNVDYIINLETDSKCVEAKYSLIRPISHNNSNIITSKLYDPDVMTLYGNYEELIEKINNFSETISNQIYKNVNYELLVKKPETVTIVNKNSNKNFSTSSSTTQSKLASSNNKNNLNTKNLNQSDRRDPCKGNTTSSWRWSLATGFDSCRKFYNSVENMSDTRLCMKAEDEFFNRVKEALLEEARYRKITCVAGVAYDNNSKSLDNALQNETIKNTIKKELDKQPKYKQVCTTERVLGERLDGSTYSKKINNCKNVPVKTNEQILNEAIGGAIMSIFD